MKTPFIGRSLGLVAACLVAACLLAAGCGGENPASQGEGPAFLAKATDRTPVKVDSTSTTAAAVADDVPVRELISPAVNPPGTIGIPTDPQTGQNRSVAVVTVTVTDQGTPVVGAAVGFSRSVSGKALDFQWSGVTDASGQTPVEITQEAWQYRRMGASGYYVARAVDPMTGDVIGTWGSLAISGGTDCGLSLPVGGRATSSPATVFAVGPSPVVRLTQEKDGGQLKEGHLPPSAFRL